MYRAFIKALLLATTLLFVLATCACAPKSRVDEATTGGIEEEPMTETTPKTPSHDQPYPEYRGVKIVIENAIPQGAHIRAENEYGYDVLSGHGFQVFIMEGNEMTEPVEFNDSAFPTILTTLSTIPYLEEGSLDFDFYFGGLAPGHYRFVMPDVYISDDTDTPWREKDIPGDFEIVSLYADFVVS
ncbi:MAG: hypothetical protein LBU48_06380 [Coriobacteriales bacterium]|jgi:hypothetical protein|nr:hypothetical protein [Coriobacteriales bacterium]